MYGSEAACFSFWWIVPIIMVVLCFLMMRGRRGAMMWRCNPRGFDINQFEGSDSAMDILDKRYASGEVQKDEYREIKKTLNDLEDSMLG